MTTPNIEELRLLAQTLEFSDAVRCSIQRAADLLQSQAERIAELDSLAASAIVAATDSQKAYMKLLDENFALRAEIAAIAATEPVAYRWVWKSKPWDIEGWCYTNTPPTLPELQEIEPLFTRPMPAQDVVPLSEYKKLQALVTSQGIRLMDYESEPAQDVTELVDALEKLARLGNGEHYGNSDGNMIARNALYKYKGAK